MHETLIPQKLDISLSSAALLNQTEPEKVPDEKAQFSINFQAVHLVELLNNIRQMSILYMYFSIIFTGQ